MPGQLAAKVRAKYPGQYDDLDDATLESKILAKYPDYADLAESNDTPYQFTGPKTPEPSMIQSLMKRYGPAASKIFQNIMQVPAPIDERTGKPFNISGGFGTKSALPDIKQPETYWGGFAKSLYDDFIKPLGSAEGVIGSSSPKFPTFKLPAQNLNRLELPPAPSRVANAGKVNVLPTGRMIASDLPEVGNIIDVPHVTQMGDIIDPDVIARTGAGVPRQRGPMGSGIDIDELREAERLKNLDYTQTGQNPGESIDVGTIQGYPSTGLPEQSGSTRFGFNPQSQGDLPYPLNVVPNMVRPRATQTAIGSETQMPLAERVYPNIPEQSSDLGFVSGGPESAMPVPEITQAPRPLFNPQMQDPMFTPVGGESAFNANRPRNPISNPQESAFQNVAANAGMKAREPEAIDAMIAQLEKTQHPAAQSLLKDLKRQRAQQELLEAGGATAHKGQPALKVDLNMAPRDAILQWTRGLSAAPIHGKHAAEQFANLTDKSLVSAYQRGARTGQLGEVQKYLDDIFELEKKLGIVDDSQYRENYLRQFWDWDKSPEEAKAVFEKRIVAENAPFTKERTFETYQAGIDAGMVPLYDNIPDIVGKRVEESFRAVRNKELYAYLRGKGWLDAKAKIQVPTEWKITGPHKNQISNDLNRFLNPKDEFTSFMGELGSTLKNIYLSGGVPYTKYNMHAFNIARADYKLTGLGGAIKELFTDPTGRKAMDWMNNLSPTEKALLPELIENGYKFNPMEDMGIFKLPGERMVEKIPGAVGRGVTKTVKTVEDMFESPLFGRALPALKFKRTMQVFNKLEPIMGREEALKRASQIGNEFYGGIEKSMMNSQSAWVPSFMKGTVRNKNMENLARFTFIAPDWAEAKIKQAVHEWASTAKTMAGKGTPADKVYAKSFARGTALTGIGVGTGAMAGREFLKSNDPRETASIPLGENAYFPTLTTADEGQRLLFQVPGEMMKGNLMALPKTLVGNRISPLFNLNKTLQGQGQYGEKLVGPQHSLSEGLGRIGDAITKPAQPQQFIAMKRYLNGEISLEEAIAMGLELPLGFKR